MKKFIKCFMVLSLFCLIFFLFEKKVRADYASSYQDYINKTGDYQTKYNIYLTARSNYLASKSLDSQDKAMSATLAMLTSRDNVMTSYLTAIEAKIQSGGGMDDATKSLLTNSLNTEISWYNAHNQKLPSAGNLNDLVSDSQQASDEYNNITLVLVYQCLIALGAGNNNAIRQEITNEITTLEAKITEIKSNQDKDVSSEERAITDIQNKIGRSQQKDTDAANVMNASQPGGNQKNNDFQTAQGDLTDSNAYLKEANQALLQIITQIKSAN